ncbi:MAG: hypothetical protein V1843_03100 [bacterium]
MEILGLLDSLESMILDSFKIPLSGKTIVNEGEILALIDKIRLVAQSGEDFAKKAIERDMHFKDDSKKDEQLIQKAVSEVSAKGISDKELEEKAAEIIEQAYEISKEIRHGADKYADDVLANLEATSSRILRTIRNGRSRLTKMVGTKESDSIAETEAVKS